MEEHQLYEPISQIAEPTSQVPEPTSAVHEPTAEVHVAYADGKTLCVPEGAALPTEWCVRSGRPSEKVVTISVRNPRNPKTWFTRQTKIDVGLCKKHLEDYRVAVALTFSMLGLGALLLVVGLINLNIITILVGLIATGISGFFRARNPVYRSEPEGWVLKLKGAGEKFLSHLPTAEPAMEGE